MEYTIKRNFGKRSQKSFSHSRTFLSLIHDDESSYSSSSKSSSDPQIRLVKQPDKSIFPFNSTPSGSKTLPGRKLGISPISTTFFPMTDHQKFPTKPIVEVLQNTSNVITNKEKDVKKSFTKRILTKRSTNRLSVVERDDVLIAPNKDISENVLKKKPLPKHQDEEDSDTDTVVIESSPKKKKVEPSHRMNRAGNSDFNKQKADEHVRDGTNKEKAKSNVPEKINSQKQMILRSSSVEDLAARRSTQQQVPLTNETENNPTNTSKINSSRRKSRKSIPVRNNQRALQEIRKYQKSTEHLIAKLPFSRLVREVAQNISDQPLRFTGVSLLALQEGAEAFLVQFLEESYLLTLHAKRVTLMPRDMKLLRLLRGF